MAPEGGTTMLQPLELRRVSLRFRAEIEQMRTFLVEAGVHVGYVEAADAIARRLIEDRAFHRDLLSHVWVLLEGSGDAPWRVADLLAILTIAATGVRQAAATEEASAHGLLRFVMEAKRAWETAPGTAAPEADVSRAVSAVPEAAAARVATTPVVPAAALMPAVPDASSDAEPVTRRDTVPAAEAAPAGEFLAASEEPQSAKSVEELPSMPATLPVMNSGSEPETTMRKRRMVFAVAGACVLLALFVAVRLLRRPSLRVERFPHRDGAPGRDASAPATPMPEIRSPEPVASASGLGAAAAAHKGPQTSSGQTSMNLHVLERAGPDKGVAPNTRAEDASSEPHGAGSLSAASTVPEAAPIVRMEAPGAKGGMAGNADTAVSGTTSSGVAAPRGATVGSGSVGSSGASAPAPRPNRGGGSVPVAVPSATLTERLDSPRLPAYAYGAEADLENNRKHPRLLRRPGANASGADAGETDLYAAMHAPDIPGTGAGGRRTTVPGPVHGVVRSTCLGMMAGNLMYSPAPAYPAAAAAARVQGEVKIQATINRDGTINAARVVSGPPLLRDAALDAVQRWRYKPYTAGGKPTPTGTMAVVEFELQ